VFTNEHRSLTRELRLIWIFLFAFLKGDLWSIRNMKFVSEHEGEEL
jgi:hypothetical protein